MKWDSFVPGSESKLVFVAVMVCYTWTLTAFINSILRAFHFDLTPAPFVASPQTQPFLCAGEVLLLSPIIESLTLVGILEAIRYFRGPNWLQVLAGAIFFGFTHSFYVDHRDHQDSIHWNLRGFAIAPGFAIQGAAYLYWRGVSCGVAFGIVLSIHALHNLMPTIPLLAYGVQHLW